MSETRTLRIDFVSDIVCPWCAIGLAGLELALERLREAVSAEVHVRPFQLEPNMPAEGADIVEHLSRKYGLSAEQVARNQEAIRERGRSVGFDFRVDRRTRTWNTFAAHRLLHWAGTRGRQLELKRELLAAYFTDGENVSDTSVLRERAQAAGLDPAGAAAVLASDAYAREVREDLNWAAGLGIQAVPSVIVDRRHLIQGGQPPEVFEQALRQIAAGR